jgi:hypothetical protein
MVADTTTGKACYSAKASEVQDAAFAIDGAAADGEVITGSAIPM